MGTADVVTGPINIANPTEFTILQLTCRLLSLPDLAPALCTDRCRKRIRASGNRISLWRRMYYSGNPLNRGTVTSSTLGTSVH
jgi:hypothetical protein